MELLKLFTAGNVDDGKSTLIGRLLYDSGSVSTDILETLTRQSKVNGVGASIDLALLTDGLRAEREQGITIDVAYKFFSTDKRKFIIADTPGHIQYTRNMFTGSSNSDLAIILIDARNGITEQTKRHTILSSIIGMPHIVVCINKMDLVGYSQSTFDKIRGEYEKFASTLKLEDIFFLPISALSGDNVVKNSTNMSWFNGEPLLSYLENVEIQSRKLSQKSRFQVQYVLRPQTADLPDYRGYCGTVLGGEFSVGDTVMVYPAGAETTITGLESKLQNVQKVTYSEPITVHLKDDIDISRGNWIVRKNDEIKVEKELSAFLLWMDNRPFDGTQKLLLRQGSFQCRAKVSSIEYILNINDYSRHNPGETLALNELAEIKLKTNEFVYYDLYDENHNSGSFILINENSNGTVAAGIFI
jgi:sulfate adenylyltransferase subunit 1